MSNGVGMKRLFRYIVLEEVEMRRDGGLKTKGCVKRSDRKQSPVPRIKKNSD